RSNSPEPPQTCKAQTNLGVKSRAGRLQPLFSPRLHIDFFNSISAQRTSPGYGETSADRQKLPMRLTR
ncbi:hypothetical protein KBY24_18945, partial [Ruegeria pomeroyi]|nr:hypothetical protein [Ruegeria pomeroyi]